MLKKNPAVTTHYTNPPKKRNLLKVIEMHAYIVYSNRLKEIMYVCEYKQKTTNDYNYLIGNESNYLLIVN